MELVEYLRPNWLEAGVGFRLPSVSPPVEERRFPRAGAVGGESGREAWLAADRKPKSEGVGGWWLATSVWGVWWPGLCNTARSRC